MVIFEKKRAIFWAMFGHLNGNFPEGQVQTITIWPCQVMWYNDYNFPSQYFMENKWYFIHKHVSFFYLFHLHTGYIHTKLIWQKDSFPKLTKPQFILKQKLVQKCVIFIGVYYYILQKSSICNMEALTTEVTVDKTIAAWFSSARDRDEGRASRLLAAAQTPLIVYIKNKCFNFS